MLITPMITLFVMLILNSHETIIFMILISHLQSGGSCDGSRLLPSRFTRVYTFTVFVCNKCSQCMHSAHLGSASTVFVGCVLRLASAAVCPHSPCCSLLYIYSWGKSAIVSFLQFWFLHGNKRFKPKPSKVLVKFTSFPSSLLGSLSGPKLNLLNTFGKK